MLLYDQGASVDWFYAGTQTYDEMKADPLHRALTEVPCVLYDNGLGEVYSFEPLESACSRWAVPYTGSPEQDFSNLVSAMTGTYKAPGVAEAQQTADEAKATADEAKGAVADATSAAQTASEAAATAQSAADEAKTTADTAAASMNEYLDALLGLDATDGTEATDAE